jgi:hypothetical protein
MWGQALAVIISRAGPAYSCRFSGMPKARLARQVSVFRVSGPTG